MKSKYQKWLWPLVILDIALIIVVVMTGPLAFEKAKGKAQTLLPTRTAVPTQAPKPLLVELLLPENIIEQQDYPFTVKMTNQFDKSIQVKSLTLPNGFMSNNELITSEPILQGSELTDTGFTYPLDMTLKPGETRSVIFILRAFKMQAITDQIMVTTDLGDQSISLMVAVAPDTLAQPYVNEAFPFKSLVKVSAMYLDPNGELKVGWSGLGAILSSDGLILTNAHTVLSNRSVPVEKVMVSIIKERDDPPQDAYYAEVLQADYYLDLAVIKVSTDLRQKAVNPNTLQLPAVEFGNPETMALGKRLSFLGMQGNASQLVTQVNGDISGFKAQEPYGDHALVHTSAVLPASFSGGIVLNEQGKMVGVSVIYVSPRGVLAEGDCRYMADTNEDREITSRDMCMPSQGVVTGLRPINLAEDMIAAAKLGEKEIRGFPVDSIIMEQGNNLLYQDNFLDMKSGWVNAVTEDRYASYDNGAYSISLSNAGLLGIGFYQNKKFTDSVTTVQVHQVTSADDAFYGVVCRYTNIENYYLFLVSTDGRYSIQKVENDTFAVLVPWTYSPIIPLNQDLELMVVCKEETLALGVNGLPLAQVNSEAHWRGMTGLAAGTFSSDHFAVSFDDIQIQTP